MAEMTEATLLGILAITVGICLWMVTGLQSKLDKLASRVETVQTSVGLHSNQFLPAIRKLVQESVAEIDRVDGLLETGLAVVGKTTDELKMQIEEAVEASKKAVKRAEDIETASANAQKRINELALEVANLTDRLDRSTERVEVEKLPVDAVMPSAGTVISDSNQ